MGVGVIIRNHEAKVMGTLRARRFLTNNPFIAESLALLLAIQFCKDLGISLYFRGRYPSNGQLNATKTLGLE